MSGAAASDVSIVIPTKNAGARLRDLLAAIRAQETRRSVEVVAFDSGSPQPPSRGGARQISSAPKPFSRWPVK